MLWRTHYQLEGTHALLSASQPQWLHYDDEKLAAMYDAKQTRELGTKLHDWARKSIELGIAFPDSQRTLIRYVNDALKYGMDPEVLLYYSDIAYGTADAICYNEKLKVLRIHDLKTGAIKGKRLQLEIYAAFFFLEYGEQYGINPYSTKIKLAIYQYDDVDYWEPEPDEINNIMEAIKNKNKVLEEYRKEAY